MIIERKFSQLSMFIMLFVGLIVRLLLIILNVFVCHAANSLKKSELAPHVLLLRRKMDVTHVPY
jgi:hypothetical protein